MYFILFLQTFALIPFTLPTQRDTLVPQNLYGHNLLNTNHNDFKFDMIICYWKVNENINDKKL